MALVLAHLGERGVADGALEEIGGCRGQGRVGTDLLIGQGRDAHTSADGRPDGRRLVVVRVMRPTVHEPLLAVNGPRTGGG